MDGALIDFGLMDWTGQVAARPRQHKCGVVQKINERSRQLADALENAVPVIITTLQKFPSSRGNCSSSPKDGARAAPACCRRGVAP
jgi:hypothetical protein